MMSGIVLLMILASVLSSAFSLNIEEQFCGGTDCVIEDFDFVVQSNIDLTATTPVTSLGFGDYGAVVGVSNIAKNNYIFTSANFAALPCSTSMAFLFEVGGNTTTPLASVALDQGSSFTCISNFDTHISTASLLKPLYFVLAVHNDIVAVAPSLNVLMSTPIVPSLLATPTTAPSLTPASDSPTTAPRLTPSTALSASPSTAPSASPSTALSASPSTAPSASPSTAPSASPSTAPSASPSTAPSASPSIAPSESQSTAPSASPSTTPSESPSTTPSASPSTTPSESPSTTPSASPSTTPSASPSTAPSESPSTTPSVSPSTAPTESPSTVPTEVVPSSLEEDFCGGEDCVIQEFNFFTQQTIDLTTENSAVTSPKYGNYATVVGVDNAAKNNFIFFSRNNVPLDCSSSRALLYESESNSVDNADPLPLSNIALTQLASTACMANFSTAISSVDLQEDLHFILAVHNDIAAVTPSLGVQISTAIVSGTRPLHVWVSTPEPNENNAILTTLSIKINALPMILSGCLETEAGLNLQLLQANDLVVPQCKFTPDNVIINTEDGTVFLEKGLTQTEYWICANSVTFPNSVLTFLIKAVPDFDGCQYYEHRSYRPYFFNVFVQYMMAQGPFGLILQQSITTLDI